MAFRIPSRPNFHRLQSQRTHSIQHLVQRKRLINGIEHPDRNLLFRTCQSTRRHLPFRTCTLSDPIRHQRPARHCRSQQSGASGRKEFPALQVWRGFSIMRTARAHRLASNSVETAERGETTALYDGFPAAEHESTQKFLHSNEIAWPRKKFSGGSACI